MSNVIHIPLPLLSMFCFKDRLVIILLIEIMNGKREGCTDYSKEY